MTKKKTKNNFEENLSRLEEISALLEEFQAKKGLRLFLKHFQK